MQAPDANQNAAANLPSKEEWRLRELQRWLTYEGLTGVLLPLSYFIPIGALLLLLVAAALIFTPYMLLRLYQCGRYGWMIGFGVAVGPPLLLFLLVRAGGSASVLLSLVPLGAFYLYTWLLHHSVSEWIDELSWEPHDLEPTG